MKNPRSSWGRWQKISHKLTLKILKALFGMKILKVGNTLPETNSSPLKMDGWNTTFLLGRPLFRGYVSFREGMSVKMVGFSKFSPGKPER